MLLYQRKSCILIVNVLIVFLVTELPRLYLPGKVFGVYRSSGWKNDSCQNKISGKTELKLQLQTGICITVNISQINNVTKLLADFYIYYSYMYSQDTVSSYLSRIFRMTSNPTIYGRRTLISTLSGRICMEQTDNEIQNHGHSS